MLYLPPEVLMPLASVAAAVGGVIMMFWRRLVLAARSLGRVITGKAKASPALSHPDEELPPE